MVSGWELDVPKFRIKFVSLVIAKSRSRRLVEIANEVPFNPIAGVWNDDRIALTADGNPASVRQEGLPNAFFQNGPAHDEVTQVGIHERSEEEKGKHLSHLR